MRYFVLRQGRICYGLRLVRLLRSRWSLLAAALATGGVLAISSPSFSGAETAPALADRVAALGRSESAAVLELYAAESALARAQGEAARLSGRSARLERDERSLQTRTDIVRRSLKASQERVAALLRALYIQGEPDPISVILGATSLDEAVAGIEGLSRATVQNRRLSAEAASKAVAFGKLRVALREQRAELAAAQRAARDGVERLGAAVASRSRDRRGRPPRTLPDGKPAGDAPGERPCGRASIGRAHGRRCATGGGRGVRAARLRRGPADEQTAAVAPAATGTHALVVDAVAYHLPGNTASGLPVGVGVIAVDPNVIPLGTRVFVPGYGPAVAADVGTAIKGNIIDLWMPSTADALQWGRRTVTITIYG